MLKPSFPLLLILSVLLAACSLGGSESKGPVRIEIISLDHAPIRPTTDEAAALAAEYGEDVTLLTLHFDTPEGDTFATDNGLNDHTPIAIFIDGETGFEIDGRAVNFLSFPQGDGPGIVADGDWTFADLRTVLDREVQGSRAG